MDKKGAQGGCRRRAGRAGAVSEIFAGRAGSGRGGRGIQRPRAAPGAALCRPEVPQEVPARPAEGKTKGIIGDNRPPSKRRRRSARDPLFEGGVQGGAFV